MGGKRNQPFLRRNVKDGKKKKRDTVVFGEKFSRKQNESVDRTSTLSREEENVF